MSIYNSLKHKQTMKKIIKYALEELNNFYAQHLKILMFHWKLSEKQ